jgi:hypothetical protein
MTTITIGGNVVNAQWGWSVNLRSYQRGTMTLTVNPNMDGSEPNLSMGDSIVVMDNATKVFEGVVKTLEIYDGTGLANGYRCYYLTCGDYNCLADKRRVAALVESMAAEDAITTYILPVLAPDGVTAGTIDADFTITRDVWRYYKASECLDRLKVLQANYVWYIDFDKKLHFKSKDQLPTVTISSTSAIRDVRWMRNMDNYFNTLYLQSSTASIRTGLQSNEILSPLADGATRTFTARFPLAKAPYALAYSMDGTSFTTVSASDIGVNGIDTGKKWWWSYNNATITQDTAETVLPAGGKVRLSYYGLRPLMMKSENLAAIASRAENEGNSGIYEHLIELTGLDDLSQATAYMNALLGKYSEIADMISFETYDYVDLYTSIYFSLSEFFKVSSKMLVDAVNISQTEVEGAERLKYVVKTIDQASFGGWETYFVDIIKNQKKFTVDETSVLQEVRSVNETVSNDGTVTLQGYEVLTLPFTFPSVLGGTKIDEVIIND